MSLYRRLFPVLIVGFGPHSSMAQMPTAAESDMMLLYENEEVVEIATGTAKPIHLAPSVASVITAKDIKAMGWRTLDEALESVPGLHVSRSGNRLNSIISMRGIHTDMNAQIVLLMNGMPIKDLVNGYRAVRFTLPVENIARIEVIRGPGSAVYGADAFAGAINIVTKDTQDLDGANIGARTGSFDTQDAWAQYGEAMGDWDVALSLEYSHSDGDHGRIVKSDFQKTLDASLGTTASLTPGPLETRYKFLNASVSATQGHWNIWFNNWHMKDAGVGAGAAEALDPVGGSDINLYNLLLGYTDKEFSKNTEFDARIFYHKLKEQNKYQIFPPTTMLPIGSDGNLCLAPACTAVGLVTFTDGYLGNPGGNSDEVRSELAFTYKGLSGQRIRTAIGVEHFNLYLTETKNFGPGVLAPPLPAVRDGTLVDVTGTANIFMPDSSRTVRYLSLQDEWQFAPDWELTAGVRYDNYSDFGNTTNPRLALVWATDYNLTTKLLYGRAFRAPTFGELYYKNNPVVTGNSNLAPETIDMLELAIDYRPTFEWSTALGMFGYRSKDMIEYINGVAQNTGKYKGKGVEAEAVWKPSNLWQLKANIAFQYAENQTTGQFVGKAPQRQAYVSGIWQPITGWIASAQAKWIADRPRSTDDIPPLRPTIGDYTLVDATLRYQPPRSAWEMAVSLRNIFDNDAREPSNGAIADDYPMEGRAAYIEGRLHVD